MFTDQEDLYSHIAELMLEDNIDFVACPIISPWHAIGVDALVYDILQRKKEKPSGVVVITPHMSPQTRPDFTISESDFMCRDFAKVRFCYLDSGSPTKELTISRQIDLAKKAFDILVAIRELKKTDKESKREMRIVTALFPNVFILRAFRSKELARKYYPIFSLLDEGIATHMPAKLWGSIDKLICQEKEPGYFQVTRFLRVKMLFNAANLIRIMGGKCLAIEKRFLSEKSHGKLVPNRRITGLYRNMIEKRAAKYKKAGKNKPVAIIITDPLLPYDEANLAEESHFMEAVINILIDIGFAVVIKPHPTELMNKYSHLSAEFKPEQVKIVQKKMSAEILFSTIKPDCVIGYDSTALVNASIIYNIPAIRITDILLSKVYYRPIKLSSEYFKRLTSLILYDADNFEKLKQMLKSIASGGAANTKFSPPSTPLGH